MSELLSPGVFLELMRDCFERGQDITFTPSGSSMLPMLDGTEDKVTFSPKPERLKKYDVAFYQRRDTGQLVLHRMIGYTASGEYIFCGDHQHAYEYGVKDEDILALMTAFTHKGKEHQVNELSYRVYIRCMMCCKHLRRFAGRIYHALFDRSSK